MTSPYIKFEEMEEGKRYIAFRSNSGSALDSDLRYFKKGGELFFEDGGYEIKSSEDHSQLVFIPVYSPPNSWDEFLDDDGDFQIIKNNEGGYFSNRAKNLANDKELLAAIDWLQDELDRRQKAGES